MKYKTNSQGRRQSKILIAAIIFSAIALLVLLGAAGARFWYESQLEPASSASKIVVVEIPKGSSVQEIADNLAELRVIKNSQAFQWYVRNNSLVESMKAGTYELDASNTTPQIVSIITEGDIKQELFTIVPGQRLSQIKKSLIDFGYSATEVDDALDPKNYANHPALVAKPSSASLEGYLYPESFNVDSSTAAKDIIEKSLDEMADIVTPELIEAWQKQGLGIHQAVSLASIVEQEVTDESGLRPSVAGVFYNRLEIGMKLESNPTYLYAGYITNQEGNSSIDSPYNTYMYAGIPPGPISNVSISALQAVAYPAENDYLFFVTGDDGLTRFSKTYEEHDQQVKKYCIENC